MPWRWLVYGDTDWNIFNLSTRWQLSGKLHTVGKVSPVHYEFGPGLDTVKKWKSPAPFGNRIYTNWAISAPYLLHIVHISLYDVTNNVHFIFCRVKPLFHIWSCPLRHSPGFAIKLKPRNYFTKHQCKLNLLFGNMQTVLNTNELKLLDSQ